MASKRSAIVEELYAGEKASQIARWLYFRTSVPDSYDALRARIKRAVLAAYRKGRRDARRSR